MHLENEFIISVVVFPFSLGFSAPDPLTLWPCICVTTPYRRKTGQKNRHHFHTFTPLCVSASELTQRITGLKAELRCSEIENISEHSWFIKESFIFRYKVITNSSKKKKQRWLKNIHIHFIYLKSRTETAKYKHTLTIYTKAGGGHRIKLHSRRIFQYKCSILAHAPTHTYIQTHTYIHTHTVLKRFKNICLFFLRSSDAIWRKLSSPALPACAPHHRTAVTVGRNLNNKAKKKPKNTTVFQPNTSKETDHLSQRDVPGQRYQVTATTSHWENNSLLNNEHFRTVLGCCGAERPQCPVGQEQCHLLDVPQRPYWPLNTSLLLFFFIYSFK